MYELDVFSWLPLDHADTHERLNLHPKEIGAGDRYRHWGRWLTVHEVSDGAKGALVLHFAELLHGAPARAVIKEGTVGVTVYRRRSA